jgi:hypothetical protein
MFHVSPLYSQGPGGVPRLISGYAFEGRPQYDFRTSFSKPDNVLYKLTFFITKQSVTNTSSQSG